MRIFLKASVAATTVAVALLIGIFFIDYGQIWTMIVFALVCYGMGHGVYWILRKIDKRCPKV